MITKEHKEKICNEYINNVLIIDTNKILTRKSKGFSKLSQFTINNICKDRLENNLSFNKLAKKYKESVRSVRQCLIENNISVQKVKFNENYFENLEDKDVCYFAGFLAADAWIGVHKNVLKNGDIKEYPCLFIENEIKDIEIIEKFKIAIGSNHKISKRHRENSRYVKGFTESCYFQITSKKLCEDLAKIGIRRNKSHDLELMGIPSKNIKHVLRGYSDGDSCWYIDNGHLRYTACSSSEKFLIYLQNILINECNLNKTKIHFSKNCYTFSYSGNIKCQKIAEYFHNDGGIYLNRKKKIIDDYFNINNSQIDKLEDIFTDKEMINKWIECWNK